MEVITATKMVLLQVMSDGECGVGQTQWSRVVDVGCRRTKEDDDEQDGAFGTPAIHHKKVLSSTNAKLLDKTNKMAVSSQ